VPASNVPPSRLALADGGHFFDLLAEDVVIDYIITTPGYPRHIEGRKAVAELYRPYGTMIVLDRYYDLAVHHDTKTGVVVLDTLPRAPWSRPAHGDHVYSDPAGHPYCLIPRPPWAPPIGSGAS
jgi:hypothetical protein